MKKKKLRKQPLLVVILLCAVLIYNMAISYSNEEEPKTKEVGNEIIEDSPDNLNIYFLDVGQADSILITNKKQNMLIDAGNNEDGPKLVKYFQELGITEFSYIVGTHPHEDHIGGLDDIINNFNTKEILLPDAYTTTKTFNDVLDAIENKHLEITVPEVGNTYKLGDANLEIIYTGDDTSDLNDTSIIIKITFGETTYLFTGDATEKVEKTIVSKDIQSDVLKVAHHGSKYSTKDEFLNVVNPSYAIISVGKNNTYKHPDNGTIDRIKKYTPNVYRTDELGTIKITSDGTNINITNFKTDTNG